MKFVSEPPVEGLGTTLDTLKTLTQGDMELKDLLDRETQQGRGNPTGHNQYTGIGLLQPNSSDIATKKRDRTGRYLRRLRSGFPELHRQVLNGERSVADAAREAGFCPRRLTINLVLPESAASAILEHGDNGYVQALIEALTKGLRDD